MTFEFTTSADAKVPSVSEDQMREIDRIAIEETGPNLFQMMENAGRNLALQSIDILGSAWKDARILVLAGSGGNGGGGICAARHLANRAANVGLMIAEPDRMNSVTAWQYHIYSVIPGDTASFVTLSDKRPDLVVDTLIGYSLHGVPRGNIKELINWTNSKSVPVLALDIPSGVDSSTGSAPGVYVTATQTMTLALPKIGLKNPAAGEIILADIGIPAETFIRAGIRYESPFEKSFRISLQRQTVNQ